MISLLLSGVVLSALAAVPQQAKQGASEKPVRTVQDLLERIRAAHGAEGALRAKLVMENTVQGQQPMPVVLEVLSVRKRAADAGDDAKKLESWSRTDFQMKMPQGPMQVTTVRRPDGILIHQSGAMTGEHWWKIDKELMTKLDTAAKKLGAAARSGAPGGPGPGTLIGAELLEGMTRSFTLELGEPTSVDGVECYRVTGKAKEREDLPPGLKMLQPDRIELYYGKKDLVLRKMVQQREGTTQMSVSLRSVAIGDAVKYNQDEFDIAPASGSFQDIMEDPIASTRIRLMLQDLSKLEEDEREAKTDKGKQAGPKKDG